MIQGQSRAGVELAFVRTWKAALASRDRQRYGGRRQTIHLNWFLDLAIIRDVRPIEATEACGL